MSEIKSYELEKKLLSKPQSFWDCSAYLFIGEENFLKEELIHNVCSKLGLKEQDCVERIDGEIIDGRELLTNLETTSFDDNKRVVVIHNADKINTDTCKQMYDFWEQAGFPQSALPIFIAENVDGRKQLWKLVKEEGLWTKFWTLFEDKVLLWIKQRASLLKLRFIPGCEITIFELCGNDLRKISKELDKLALAYDQKPITPDIIKFMIRKSTEVSKYEIEDQFANRNIKNVLRLLNEAKDKIESKDIVMSLARCTRYALQALYYSEQDFAFQLAEIGKQIYTLSRHNDWNSISKRNDLIKAGNAVIEAIPMQVKMLWSGNYNFSQSSENVETEQNDIIDEEGKKKRKTKKDKIADYDIDAATKKNEIDIQRKFAQDLSYDIYNHNIWAQKNIMPIVKAFLMTKKYSKTELLDLLLQLSRLYFSVWAGDEDLIIGKLETNLLALV